MAICKGCGKEIQFIPLKSGKKAPVEMRPVYYEDTERGSKVIVTEDGRISKGREAVIFSEGAVRGYLSHFVACPAAEAFRQKK